MFNLFSKTPAADPGESTPEDSLNLDANSSSELQRVTVNPSAGLPQDSAVIPNIEAWLKGRSETKEREILRNQFDDSVFKA